MNETPIQNKTVQETDVASQPSPDDSEDKNQVVDTPAPTENISRILIANLERIQPKQRYLPYFPGYISISGNQEVIAVGGLSGVSIIDSQTRDEIMKIEVDLPMCQYGLESYLHFDHTGNFIAVATLTGVEIWQVGGGKIYSAPYMHGQTLDIQTCGLDVPQLALSPNGELLAQSGMYISHAGYTEYFQVINVLENSVVYRWDGNEEQMHGSLNMYPELGFSSDGSVLQTFLPEKFQFFTGNYGSAFKFWSMESTSALNADPDTIQAAVDPGDLLFAVSSDDAVYILGKEDGRKVSQIDVDGCTLASPCSVIFSEDGEKLAVLQISETFFYKRDSMITKALIYDITSKELMNEVDLIAKDKNGTVLKKNGELLFLQADGSIGPTWWTQPAYFSGLREERSSVVFNPQVYNFQRDDPFYSGTCFIDLDTLETACEDGISLGEETTIEMAYLDNGFALYEADSVIAQIKYPPGSAQDTWQVRIKAYDGQTNIGYFCLDRNQREETCVIMDFSENKILEEQIDLFGFIRSRDTAISAFINRQEKRLIIFSEQSPSLRTIVPFEAVAFPVKPALLGNGEEILYFVESLNSDDLFIDHVLLDGGKVIKRYAYEKWGEGVPTAISVHPDQGIWAIGDTEGQIFFYDPETESIVFTISASAYGIEDLLFTSGGKQLFVVDQLGIITRWVIEE